MTTGAELVWLGRQDQDQTEWTMEQKILEILEISRKNQPQEFDRLQVFKIICCLIFIYLLKTSNYCHFLYLELHNHLISVARDRQITCWTWTLVRTWTLQTCCGRSSPSVNPTPSSPTPSTFSSRPSLPRIFGLSCIPATTAVWLASCANAWPQVPCRTCLELGRSLCSWKWELKSWGEIQVTIYSQVTMPVR